MQTPRSRLALALTVVAASFLASCTGPSDDAGVATTGEEPAAACPPPPVDPDEPRAFQSGGQERAYLLSLPEREPAAEGFPLVVNLHGHGGSAAEHEANTSLAAVGRDNGFVVATPEGLGDPRRWNFDRRASGPDDYAFVNELIDDLIRWACVDPARLYAVGSSNGAAFAGFLTCTEPTRIAAVAMVIATVPPTCPPDVTPSMLTVRGTADATVPYDGTLEMVAAWAEHNGCAVSPRDEEPQPGVTRTTYDRCVDDAPAILVTIAGGGHAWPGGTGADRPGNSEAGSAFSATEEILSFLVEAGRTP